eukprot:TRINITY_DN26241_c0_g1_i2.p1 TRINITY_DN26241_c0_g1~~TRINITY_DN26241_c0_g1_i2.p1  ORF type:complete len:844 (+),score=200.43 TRINITY_DN26241_c0_g1_i2:142-2532(+)
MVDRLDVPGPWLRDWLEFHVDARINDALRDVLTSGFLAGSARANAPVAAVSGGECANAANSGAAGAPGGVSETAPAASSELLELRQSVAELRRLHGEVRARCENTAVELERCRSLRGEPFALDLESQACAAVDRLEARFTQWRHEFASRLDRELHDLVALRQSDARALDTRLARLEDVRVSAAELCEAVECRIATIDSRCARSEDIANSAVARLSAFQRDVGVTSEAVVHVADVARRHATLESRMSTAEQELAAVAKAQRDAGSRASRLESKLARCNEDARLALEAKLDETSRHLEAKLHETHMHLEKSLQGHVESRLESHGALGSRLEETTAQVHAHLTGLLERDGEQHSRLDSCAACLKALCEREETQNQRFAALVAQVDDLANQGPPALANENTVDSVAALVDLASTVAELALRVERLEAEANRGSIQSERFERDLVALAAAHGAMDVHLTGLRQKADASGAEELQSRESAEAQELQPALEALSTRLDERSAAEAVKLRECLESRCSEVAAEVEASRAALQRETDVLARRLTAELKIELRTGMRTEAAALAALDEQLWLTDRRLGTRIDAVERQTPSAHRLASDAASVGDVRQAGPTESPIVVATSVATTALGEPDMEPAASTCRLDQLAQMHPREASVSTERSCNGMVWCAEKHWAEQWALLAESEQSRASASVSVAAAATPAVPRRRIAGGANAAVSQRRVSPVRRRGASAGRLAGSPAATTSASTAQGVSGVGARGAPSRQRGKRDWDRRSTSPPSSKTKVADDSDGECLRELCRKLRGAAKGLPVAQGP